MRKVGVVFSLYFQAWMSNFRAKQFISSQHDVLELIKPNCVSAMTRDENGNGDGDGDDDENDGGHVDGDGDEDEVDGATRSDT